MEALLIVDMQNGCFASSERYQAASVINNINQLAEVFRQHGKTVILIQHEDDNDFRPGSDGWQLLDSLSIGEGDMVVSKTCCNAFVATNLAHFLHAKQISRLVVCGCATDFCVDSTIKGALACQFDVVIASDAHTTADRPYLNAKQVIEHFNWNWSELLCGKSNIEVLPTAQLVELFGCNESLLTSVQPR